MIGLANVRLKHERDRAETQRLEAVANLRKARDAVDRMLTRVSEQRLKNIPQVEPIQRALLEDALEFYRDFARQAHDDPEILLEASRAYRRLGQTHYFFGRSSEAERCIAEALAIQTKLVVDFPQIAAHRAELVRTQIQVARQLRDSDQTSEAIESANQAVGLVEGLMTVDRENTEYGAQLATALHTRAMIFQDLPNVEAAKADYRRSITLLDKLAGQIPADTEHRTKAAVSRHNLAILIEDEGQLEESERIHRVNLKFWEELEAGEPTNSDYRSKVAMTLESLAGLLEKIGRNSEVVSVLRRAADQRLRSPRTSPAHPIISAGWPARSVHSRRWQPLTVI